MQAVHSYPNFIGTISSVTQISKLEEELVKEYERYSNQAYPRLSTLLRCIPSPLRRNTYISS